MNRREFIETVGAAALIPLIQTKRRNFVWMRPSLTRTAAEWRREFALMRASGITGIIPEVYNGRQTLFHSKRLPVRATWLEDTIPLATEAGLDVHAWMW